jgi:acyl-CoA thioester hydrolase
MFSLPVVINYEDTDAAGVVYYANYLAYMERARNACLREAGFPLTTVREEYHTVFVVAEVNLRYVSPARLDDEISVTLGVREMRGASMKFVQQVLRGGELLVDGCIRLATLRSDTFSPGRMPEVIRQALERHRIE